MTFELLLVLHAAFVADEIWEFDKLCLNQLVRITSKFFFSRLPSNTIETQPRAEKPHRVGYKVRALGLGSQLGFGLGLVGVRVRVGTQNKTRAVTVKGILHTSIIYGTLVG